MPASEPHPKLECNNVKFGWTRAGLNVHHHVVCVVYKVEDCWPRSMGLSSSRFEE